MNVRKQKNAIAATSINENTLAFILGFATLMPALSIQIYPLDFRNIESLIAKILPYHINSTHHSALLKIKDVLTKWRIYVERSPETAFLDYKQEYLYYIHDSITLSAGFYNFVLSTCKYTRPLKKNKRILKKSIDDIRNNDKRKWGLRCVYYKCPHNDFHHPKSIARALEQLHSEINEIIQPYAGNCFYILGKTLASCYGVREYEIEYLERLGAYCQEFRQFIPHRETKLDDICALVKTDAIKNWKQRIIDIANTNDPRDFREIDFSSFPVLIATWKIFEESIRLIVDMPFTQVNALDTDTTSSKQVKSSAKKPKPHYAVPINVAAVIIGVSESSVSNWVRGKGTVPRGFPGLDDETNLRIWADQYNAGNALRRERREMRKARPYSPDYIDSQTKHAVNSLNTPEIDE